MELHTRVTDRLGIDVPIVLAPMGPWAEPSLAAAVSNAGGLGTFGAAGRLLGQTEEYVRNSITALREHTNKPFGAGFITQLIPENPPNLDIVLEAEVPVVLFSFGDPTPYIALAKQTPATVICQVQSFDDARIAIDAGADILAVQGNEAGGHTGSHNLLPFLTQVLDAFPDTPVLAAGGMSNGRALAAVLAAGADGAWVGTALLAAEEAAFVQPVHREAMIASDGNDTVFSSAYDIMYTAGFRFPAWPEGVAFRTRRFPFVERWLGREDELPAQAAALVSEFRAGVRAGDPEYQALIYGEGARSVTGSKPARQIIDDLITDAVNRLRSFRG
jgi:nitronate monooxygenase